jgi:signal transduction histidine kinase/ligand-binding sensor domain-containing protein/AraC-like DNA-binding protein/DNA-binding NarL/FixJ family response regulator
MIKKLTFTLLLALIGSIGFAQLQKIPFERYGVAEGLPEEWVRGMLQDDKGFIWFGTQNGLVKYDGYNFKVYKATSDTTSLQFRNVNTGLLKSKDGKIWIGGRTISATIASFDPLTEKFRNFYLGAKTFNAKDEGFSFLQFEDNSGNIWFKNSFFRFNNIITSRLNPKTGVIKQYPIADINGGNPHLRSFGTIESFGTIWLLDNKNNLNRLNRLKDKFEITIPAGKDLLQLGKADTLIQLSKGRNNRLLLTGTHGLYIFDTKVQKIVKSYVHQSGKTNGIADSIFYAYEDLKGQIWVAHRQGKISVIAPASGNIQTFTYGSKLLPYQKGVNEILYFFPLNDTKEGIRFQALDKDLIPRFFVYYQFAKKTFSIYDYNFNLRNNPLPLFPIPYLSIVDRTGLLWLGTRPGLFKQAPKKQQMDLFRYSANEPSSLPSDNIQCLFEDSKKRLWIGTAKGLAIYQSGQDNFRVFKNNPANPASLSNNHIIMIQEDADGKIWVCTSNGLNQWQESTSNFKRFFYNPTEVNIIAFLFPDKQQRLWLSIYNKGVFVLNKNTGKILKSFIPNIKNTASLTSKQIDVFYQDSRGTIWLGDGQANKCGLYRLNQTENGFTNYLPILGDSSSISSDRISLIAEDGKKRLFIGTQGGGLNSFNYTTNRFIRYSHPNTTTVANFATDKKGEPWFGIYSGSGLVSLDVKKRTFDTYDETNGLLHNDVLGGSNSKITKDDYGRFWLSTQRGLSVFDPENKRFISYFEKDGFQPYGRRYVSIKTSNGDLWIGGQQGLNHILPASLLKKDSTIPSVVVTQVSINDSLYSKSDGNIFKQSVAYTYDIELKYWQKNLSFDFVALHYLRSEDNQYSWKLENYNKDWSIPSKERKASYTNLSPGKYIFRVKASNADGVWNEEGISLIITILPPWYQTWWAYLFYTAIIAGIIILLYRFDIKNRLQKAEALRIIELDEVKTKLYTNITHEFRTPLTVILGIAQQVLENPQTHFREGLKMIIRNGQNLLTLVNQMLDLSKLESGKLTLHYHRSDILSFLEYIVESFDSLAENKGIQLHFIPSAEQLIMDFDEVRLQQIVSNILSNAIKFTPNGGQVYVSSDLYDERFILKIKDTGIGINETDLPLIFDRFYQSDGTHTRQGEGTGIGLSLTRELVKIMDGTINVKSQLGKGTVFEVSLPLRQISNFKEGSQPSPFLKTIKIKHPKILSHSESLSSATIEVLKDKNSISNKPYILISDDNADVRAYLSSCLENDYVVEIANNGQECEDLSFKTIPDLIVLDVMMPFKDGFEVCKTLKTDERTSHIPIIMLTAKAAIESRLEGLEQGADDYLTKPFHKKELLLRIKNLLELRRQLQQYYRSTLEVTSSEGNLPIAENPIPTSVNTLKDTEKSSKNPSIPLANSLENAFVVKVRKAIEAHMDSPDFDVEKLCRYLALSHSQVHRKLSALTGLSATHFMRYVRLVKAKEMINSSGYSIAAIALDCGFNDPAYFSRVFKQEFGITPQGWREQNSP